MPIETQKEKERFGNPLEDMQGKNFKLTLDRKSEGKNIELHFKGPGSREELEKALSEGKLPSGWESTVSYGKKGKEYAIDSATLFDNYLKGTKFDGESTSIGARAVGEKAYRDKTSAGAIEVAYEVSRKDKSSSGAIDVEHTTVRDSTSAGASKVRSSISRGSTSSGAINIDYTKSRDSSSSGAIVLPFTKSRGATSSGATSVDYTTARDSSSSGATVLPFSKSRGSTTSGAGEVLSAKSRDKPSAGAVEVDNKLFRDARKKDAEYASARGKTSSGGVTAEFELTRDQTKKGRTKNAAEEKPGDVAESD